MKTRTKRTKTPSAAPARPRPAVGRSPAEGAPRVAGVTITHPERLVYPDAGLTKLALARYYEAVGLRMLPHIVGRPLTLVLCPDGVGPGCTYLKHGPRWTPRVLRRVEIEEKTKVGEYLVVESIEGLVALIQMNWLEAHTWNSTIDHLERPDRLVFDLDPGPDVSWAEVIEAARHVRATLRSHSLESWVKTTGGRGLHVVVPLEPVADWDACLAFARSLAEAMTKKEPERYTIKFAKAGRERKLLVDYLRNNRTNTSIAAFSPRATSGAPVSMPLAWEELTARVRPAQFTVKTVPGRLARTRSDAWKGYWTSKQRLP